MSEYMFRLLELHQKLDAMIARARLRRFADPVEIARLRERKLRIRDRLARLFPPVLPAH